MISVATCDQLSGTDTSSILNTIEPSGFLISDRRFANLIDDKGSFPAVVNSLFTCIKLSGFYIGCLNENKILLKVEGYSLYK
jgi:hypothetical protein